MRPTIRLFAGALLFMTLGFGHASAARTPRHDFTEPSVPGDPFSDASRATKPSATAQDTIWIATWTFETGAACDLSGWERMDNRVRNDGAVYWAIDASFGGTGNIVGSAATLGISNDPCCDEPNGYDNDWYQAIRIEYTGSNATLSFDFIIDVEPDFDLLSVETDSACASLARVDYDTDPSGAAQSFRNQVFTASGFDLAGAVNSLALDDYGPGTHCVYIAFFSDGAFSPCDGLYATIVGRALVVDHIVIEDASGTRSEDFEDGTLDVGTLVNIQDSAPFGPTAAGRDGSWGRVYRHITDNDACTENTSCAVLWTDDVTPTIALDPSMAFAPGGYVVKNWLDDIIVSPWVSLATTPGANSTIVQFRRFPGNFFSTSRLVQNWSIRGKVDVDDGMGGTLECVGAWGHAFQWNSLSFFGWIVPTASGNPRGAGYDASSSFEPSSKAIQIRHRTSDWQWIVGATPPSVFNPGPGPYIDRTRIGRIVLTGPVLDEGIDARYQAQDAFPTELDPNIPPGSGERYRASTDRFGTVAFSHARELGQELSPNIIIGDSVRMVVQDVRGAGGITSIDLYATIVSGPHVGRAPPPHVVGAHGFFVVNADSVRNTIGTVVEDLFFADLDDQYFVGGDVLHYFWLAQDALGGVASMPTGLTTVPTSIAEAQAATQGMYEVSFLPTIDWDSDYLAAVQAGNKVDPQSDPSFLDNSTQAHCILYVNRIDSRRRSGTINRTSFMYTMDTMGYAPDYDVYDHSGIGNTNNHLGSRATVPQAQGYNLIVYDAGIVGPVGTIMPDGQDPDAEKVDQAGWFVNWLEQASVSEAQFATLWIVGANVLEEKPTNVLYTTYMATSLASTDQSLDVNPDVLGQTSFTFDVGAGSNLVDFTVGARSAYSLSGGCPVPRDYDAQEAAGTGVNVFRFAHPVTGATGNAAVVMNSSPAANWNTIFMSHPWFDIHQDVPGTLTAAQDLFKTVTDNVLLVDCIRFETIDTGEVPGVTAPRRTALHRNVPNPFNPVTTIRFDLARDGHVSLRVFDIAGRHVRTLLDASQRAGRDIEIVWDGRDAAQRTVSSGVYFYTLETQDFRATRKMIVLR